MELLPVPPRRVGSTTPHRLLDELHSHVAIRHRPRPMAELHLPRRQGTVSGAIEAPLWLRALA